MSHVNFSREGLLGILTFDREGSSANLFDRACLEALYELLAGIAREADRGGLRQLLIRSAKPTIFIAGADLRELGSTDVAQLSDLIELGQQCFNRLADLPIPTAAAIHGACLGGGFELALACDWRAASNSDKTKIGLPETQLGILPAWGGTTRLPRLVGLSTALPLILGGKVLGAEGARRKGLVDGVTPVDHEEVLARQFLDRGNRTQESHALEHNPAAVAVIRRKAAADLKEKTRGLYPGPARALEVACNGVTSSRVESLAAEKKAILDLAQRPETHQLIRLFFLREKARKHLSVDAEPRAVDRIGVIGAGVMGSGIAYWTSTRGLPTSLADINWGALAAGLGRIDALYTEAKHRHVLSATEAARGRDRITAGTELSLRPCDLVIEAATEELSIKKKIFANLSKHCREDAILATNTSALPIHELAEVITRPERLLGLHFFNPVHRMQLVEVVHTPQTDDEALATAIAFVHRLGKIPVVVADSPGFLVNRILLPYLVEAARLFERGGDPEAIDKAMLDFGMPMGPLRLLDEVGLDVATHVARTLAEAFPKRMEVPEIVERLSEAGFTGRKGTGGFYLYKNGKVVEPNAEALALQRGDEPPSENLAEHFAGLMHEEAQLCLDEGVARDADDIDLAMVLGTGYAPFRGGPMQFDDSPSPTGSDCDRHGD